MSTSSVKAKSRPDFWEKQHEAVTSDEIIDAYLQGKADGEREYKSKEDAANLLLFKKNVEKAQKASEKLLHVFQGQDIRIVRIFLKAESVDQFCSLLIAEPADYVSEKFLSGINAGRQLSSQLDSIEFGILFNYTHSAKTLDHDAILHDGYFLRYDVK